MRHSSGERDAEFYAQTYDASVPDWPAEIAFYREMATETKATGGSVLEIACGTGRVAIRLAHEGVNVVGRQRRFQFDSLDRVWYNNLRCSQ